MGNEDVPVDQMQELKDLVNQQARDTATLIAELARARGAPGPGGPAHVPDRGAAAAARMADKISKLGISLRKAYKVKEFKDVNEGSVKEWLTRFDQEIITLKKLSGIADGLIREEIVELFLRLPQKILYGGGPTSHITSSR